MSDDGYWRSFLGNVGLLTQGHVDAELPQSGGPNYALQDTASKSLLKQELKIARILHRSTLE